MTADYLDLSEAPRRVELTQKQGPLETKKRFGSLRAIPTGTNFTTQRGNTLTRISDTELLLSGKVRIAVPPRPSTPSNVSGMSDTRSDVSMGSAVSNTWNELEDTYSRLVCNVLKTTAQTIVGMLLDESRMSGGMYVEVVKLLPEGAAAKAGIQVGDLVLKIDDRRVVAETAAAAMMKEPGVHVFEIARRRQAREAPRKQIGGFLGGMMGRAGHDCYARPSDDAATMISMASSTGSSAIPR